MYKAKQKDYFDSKDHLLVRFKWGRQPMVKKEKMNNKTKSEI